LSLKKWDHKKVLVTGAGGFIGSHLTERLVSEGARVSAFVHYNSQNQWGNLESVSREILDEIQIIPGDLTDPYSVERAVRGCETVFHLGALIAIPYSYEAPWHFVSTNVMGLVNVLEACRKHDIEKMVHTSTSEVYGTAMYTPIDENHPLQAQSPYSASKISADKMAESYFRSFDLPVAIIRPFNTYGPRQSARAIIPTIVSQNLTGNRIRLGALDPIRDLTYVDDTVEGFLAVGQSERTIGEVINIGSGKGISILDLAHFIMEIMGRSAMDIMRDEKRFRPERSEVYELVCNNQKAKVLCGWRPKYSLREGLEKTIAWVRQNVERMKPHLYST
jgi:NAD dependent epimerase/dehydratase